MKQSLLLSFAIILITSLLYADGTQPPGDGSSGSPYQVSNLDHLLWISTNSASWSSYFEQTANIDAGETSTWNSGAGFIPIGNDPSYFTGNYNGGNHTISNLFINRSSEYYIGLFGSVKGAIISNLALVGVKITGGNYVGSLVGYASGFSPSIQNCYSSGTVTASWGYAGGIVGLIFSGSVDRCYCTGTVSGGACIGGHVGYSSWATCRNCYTRSDVTRTEDGSNDTNVGAFCGYFNGGTFEHCYATGRVDCGSETSKGFIGSFSFAYEAIYTANFFDSEATGQATGTGATAKTTEEMTTLATFTDAGWDFEIETTNGTDDYWDMDLSGSYNDGYPFLDWQNGGDTALPVELAGFSAHCAGLAVVLKWATESETDNLGFILERADGNTSSWQVIASYQTEAALSSCVNSSSHTEYSFTDNTAQAGVRYSYRLSDVNTQGSITVHSSLSIVVAALPLTTTLAKAYPNPFNPRTTITWELAADGEVNLTVYDMLGRKVRELSTGYRSAGSYQVTWNGADDSGVSAASGSYLIRLQTDDTNQVQKVMLIK